MDAGSACGRARPPQKDYYIPTSTFATLPSGAIICTIRRPWRGGWNGDAGPKFAKMLAAAAIAVIDFVANWLLKRLRIKGESPPLAASGIEFALEGLHLSRRLNKHQTSAGSRYGS